MRYCWSNRANKCQMRSRAISMSTKCQNNHELMSKMTDFRLDFRTLCKFNRFMKIRLAFFTFLRLFV